MSTVIPQESYALVYEGEVDAKLETLQKIKGVFIADLDLSIPQVRDILAHRPATIKTSATKEDLLTAYEALSKAGAKVMIVQSGHSSASTAQETTAALSSLTSALADDAEPYDFFCDHEPESFRELHAGEIAESMQGNDGLEILLSLDESHDARTAELAKVHPAPIVQQTRAEAAAAAEEDLIEIADASEPFLSLDSPVSGQQNTGGESQPSSLFSEEELSIQLDNSDSSPAALVEPAAQAGKPIPVISSSLTIAPLELETQPASPPNQDEIMDLLQDEPLSLTPVEEQHYDAAISDHPAKIDTQVLTFEPAPRSTLKTVEHTATTEEQPVKDTVPAPLVENPDLHYSARPHGANRFHIPWDMVAPILIGVMVLLGGNWYFFSSQKAAQSALRQAPRKPLLPTGIKAQAAPVKPPQISVLKGAAVSDGVESKLEIQVEDNKASYASLTVTTPPPAELTPEEIVTNRRPVPWINKAIVEKAKLTQHANGNLTGEALARIYIEDAGKRERIPAKADLRGRYNPQTKGASLSFTINAQYPNLPAAGNYDIRLSDSGSYQLFIRGQIEAK